MTALKYSIRPGKNKDNPANIIMRVYEGREYDLHAKTNLYILPEFWKTTPKGKIKISELCESKDYLNEHLKLLKRRVIDALSIEPDQTKLNSYWLKTVIDKYWNPEKYEEKPVTFYEYIDIFIKRVEADRTPGTLKQYRNAKNRFKQFDTYRNIETTFENVDMTWYHAFKDYSIKIHNSQNNTIAKYLKMLKTFLHEAEDEGIKVNPAYRSKKFKKPSNESSTIYLTDEEIKSIYDLDLSKDEELEQTRDLFVFGCQTGLRFSDYTNVKKENIKGNNLLNITAIKTNNVVSIPLDYIALEILKKYNFKLPKGPDNATFNLNLKAIGQRANIDEKIQIVKKVGALRTETTVKKYKLMQSHTARRSFATNCYLDGIPTQEIMRLSGHKTEKSFLRYLRITQNQAASRMAQHPRFAQKSNLKVVS
jgi:integrase